MSETTSTTGTSGTTDTTYTTDTTGTSVTVQSIILEKLLDDPQMKEVVVMEYEQLTPKQMFNNLRAKANQQGHLLIPNWLALLLCNLLLALLFALIGSAAMLAQSPPGIANTITAEPLKYNQSYYTECFTWDSSCDQTKNLWCVDGRCQCYNQLTYWNGTECPQCFNGSYYNGTDCVCPSYSYLDITSTNQCQIYHNYSQSCLNVLCNPTPGLICSSTSNTCVCPDGYYWNSTNSNDPKGYCVRYSSNTEQCNSTSQCSPNTSLICVNNTCQCPSTGKWYWTGSECTQIASYNGSCIIDQQCDGTLQLICNNSRCVCAGSTPYGTWFWNGTQCVLCPLGWLNYDLYCYYNSQATATWNNSRAYCQKFGADLLVIKNQAEFDFISPKAAAIIGAKRLAFIGYYTVSNATPGVFAWLDSTMPRFTGDHTNQPWWCGPQPTFSKSSAYTPTVQGCGALQLVGTTVCMNDWWFSELLPFICKKAQ